MSSFVQEDYTGKLGQLGSGKEWEMHSYERVAYEFWNAFANQLRRRGLAEEEIKDELQSKGPRWMLDAHSDLIEKLAFRMADRYELVCKG